MPRLVIPGVSGFFGIYIPVRPVVISATVVNRSRAYITDGRPHNQMLLSARFTRKRKPFPRMTIPLCILYASSALLMLG